MKSILIIFISFIIMSSCTKNGGNRIYFGLNNKMIIKEYNDTLRLYGNGFYRYIDLYKRSDNFLTFPKNSFEASVLFDVVEKGKPESLVYNIKNDFRYLDISLDSIIYQFEIYNNIPKWDSLIIDYFTDNDNLQLHKVFKYGKYSEIDIFSLIIINGFADSYNQESSNSDSYKCTLYLSNGEIVNSVITVLPYYTSKIFFKKWKSNPGPII